MSNLSWGQCLILASGGFVILCAAYLIANEQLQKYKRKVRRNKRLYGHGNIYSLRDFK
jgi:hypothetical protein